MTFEQSLVLVIAALLAVAALAGALMSWRVLGRTGSGLRELDTRLTARTQTLPRSAAATRERLISVRAETEAALWSLATLDEQLDSTRLTLADRRAASDRLRESMADNQAVFERIRNGARMLLRVIQMRREFLG